MPLLVFWVLFLAQSQSHAQSSIELTCRSQAKEIAVQTYQNCVTQARAQKVDEIRKEYQAKLTELKSYYDQELKGLTGSKAQAQSRPAKKSRAATRSTISSQAPAPRADRLPEKQTATHTMSVQQQPNENTKAVVTREIPEPEISTGEVEPDQAPASDMNESMQSE